MRVCACVCVEQAYKNNRGGDVGRGNLIVASRHLFCLPTSRFRLTYNSNSDNNIIISYHRQSINEPIDHANVISISFSFPKSSSSSSAQGSASATLGTVFAVLISGLPDDMLEEGSLA